MRLVDARIRRSAGNRLAMRPAGRILLVYVGNYLSLLLSVACQTGLHNSDLCGAVVAKPRRLQIDRLTAELTGAFDTMRAAVV